MVFAGASSVWFGLNLLWRIFKIGRASVFYNLLCKALSSRPFNTTISVICSRVIACAFHSVFSVFGAGSRVVSNK